MNDKTIKVELPTVFDVVEDEEMIRIIKEGKWIIIAIPVKEAKVEDEKVEIE